MRAIVVIVGVLWLVADPKAARAQGLSDRPVPDSAARTIAIPHVTDPPSLAEVWARHLPAAAVLSDFRQNRPGDGLPASVSTVSFLYFDDQNLYVIFDCRDIPSNVRAHLAKREDIGSDDRVIVYLDTFRDHRRAYVFEVNPLGIQRDGILTEGQGIDYSYDGVWRSEGTLTEEGFVVLLAIPFKALRFSKNDVQTWGIALGRNMQRRSELAYWPPITTRIQGFVNQMGLVEGLRNLRPGHNAQLVPYGAVTGSRYLDTTAPAFVRTDEGRGGVDAKVVTNNGATLDVTVNPDFSQVESDNPQVTVNRRFEVFFPEKRPFFTENAGYFSTPERFVFSRRIVDPQFGARLTGKSKGWAFGALIADDRAEGHRLPIDDPLWGQRAGNAILRIQRDVGRESTVGVIATDREFGPSFSRLVAADTRLKLSPNWVFTGQASGSDSETLGGARRHGSALKAVIQGGNRNLTYTSTYRQLSPDFKPALGFIQRVDFRETNHYLGYLRHLDHGPVTSFGPALSGSMDWNYAGIRQDWSIDPTFDIYFRSESGISVYHSSSYERFDDVEFDKHSTSLSAYSSYSRLLSLNGSYTWGTSPNYSPADGSRPSLGNDRSVSLGLTLRPSQRFRVDESYYFSHLQTRDDGASTLPASDIFTNHISRTRASIQISKALSIRAIADYDLLVSDASLINQDVSKRLTGDLLVTYLVNPFSAIYIGYTEGRRNLDIDPADRRTLRVLPSPSTPVLRQLFVKVSYRLAL